ncbi:glycerol kinase [Microbacterium lushaniae]|nr:glycerol kinase [Microbacterium lushaniae]KAA9155235.1 glycerol kinase [Microbacterium lushaniae]
MAERERAVIAVDQGTSSTKAIMIAGDGRILARFAVNISRRDPAPGCVEQDATEIFESVVTAVSRVSELSDADVLGLGLSNQRESAVIWDPRTGEPLGPMLGWQDRRTAARVSELQAQGWADRIRAKTGLNLDPMFSALKLEWLLDQVDPDREAARRGDIAFGTVDSWLVFRLTGEHRIEMGNASRTQLFNLEQRDWDEEILDLFRIPRAVMPRVASSDEPTGRITTIPALAEGVRIHGILGDSHAALYAHGVRTPGHVKATYGSGSSIMGLEAADTGDLGSCGLVRTIGWATPEPAFAFEGTIVSTGATVLWLANLVGVEPEQLSTFAQTVADTQGVALVPAFGGLSAPWWDDEAVALVSGLGLGTQVAHLARAAFESIVHQTEDLFSAVEEGLGGSIEAVLADGGPTRNAWLMQMQADYGQRRVLQSEIAELSATGAGHLAGLGCGLWSDDECLTLARERQAFEPAMAPDDARARRDDWRDAVARARFRAPTRSRREQ